MRLSVVLGCLVLVGCSGPHSNGALWARRNIEQETALFRSGDAQRAERAFAFERQLAEASLASERTRIEASLQACPGAVRQQLALSPGDRTRDSVRIRAGGDATLLASVAQIALADWRVRRAQATGEARFCDDARQALGAPLAIDSAAAQAGGDSASDPLAGAGISTVSRDPLRAGALAEEAWPADVALSSYALGVVDTVRARAPLPQYLAAVYGGEVLGATGPAAAAGAGAESVVDRFAPAYPAWEPDALYCAVLAACTR